MAPAIAVLYKIRQLDQPQPPVVAQPLKRLHDKCADAPELAAEPPVVAQPLKRLHDKCADVPPLVAEPPVVAQPLKRLHDKCAAAPPLAAQHDRRTAALPPTSVRPPTGAARHPLAQYIKQQIASELKATKALHG